jgi:hypothetical protein
VFDVDPTLISKRTSEAMALGLTRKKLRGPSYLRPAYGIVRPSDLEADELTLFLADVLARTGPSTVVGGWAALRLQGSEWFDGRDRHGDLRPVLLHCLPGAQPRRDRMIQPFRGTIHPDEITDLGQFAVATPGRAVFDEMRLARGLRDAVVALEMAVSRTHGQPRTSMESVRRVERSHHKVRGIVQARRAINLATDRSASPWETRTRLLAQEDAGLTRLGVNVPIFTPDGRLLGVADLLDEDVGLVIESDGGDHRGLHRHTDDNRREERFERSGLVVVRVTALDHADRWGTVGRIVAAHRDAQRATTRDWTTAKPAWWEQWQPARRWD